MSLFGGKEKKEIELLRSQMSAEQLQSVDLSKEIATKTEVLNKLNSEIFAANSKLAEIKKNVIETDEAVLLQTFGIYTPHYFYQLSDEYKEQLNSIRTQQKDLIKSGKAVTGAVNWTVNGNASKGKKMVKDMQKLLLRAFSAECDDAIEHVRFNNVEACEKKIRTSADAISHLGEMMQIEISYRYVNMKLQELYLMHEYRLKKEQEKEAAKEARQRQREEAKVAKELEEARKKLEKEQNHYENALSRIELQLQGELEEDARHALEEKRTELMEQLSKIDEEIANVDYRAANQRAGYVYVISNIGSFGEGVYKIGMTRRLEPMERIDELGDASVPFNFDVHALIFTDDAPALETALHNAFADRKVNFVNQRREFFRVSLDEIKREIKNNFDKTVEFVDIAPAEQYRESLKLRSTQGTVQEATQALSRPVEGSVLSAVENKPLSSNSAEEICRVCHNCGSRLSNTARFCGKCGSKVE